MDSLRSELINVREFFDWLPNPVVALLIIGFALLVALTLHCWLRSLIGRLLARRYPYFYTILTQTRGLTRLGILLLALVIAVPVALGFHLLRKVIPMGCFSDSLSLFVPFG